MILNLYDITKTIKESVIYLSHKIEIIDAYEIEDKLGIFHGISGIANYNDNEIILVSDKDKIFRIKLPIVIENNLLKVEEVLSNINFYDSEEIEYLGNNLFLISHEDKNNFALYKYTDNQFILEENFFLPEEFINKLPRNGGIEAITKHASSILAIAEFPSDNTTDIHDGVIANFINNEFINICYKSSFSNRVTSMSSIDDKIFLLEVKRFKQEENKYFHNTEIKLLNNFGLDCYQGETLLHFIFDKNEAINHYMGNFESITLSIVDDYYLMYLFSDNNLGTENEVTTLLRIKYFPYELDYYYE